ncbi:inner membrane protein import complex subunit Tim54-domain-containing protein [Syncephalis fuscata]|nr:inner membrane protein import complex subunit Tim54-domain-containing protein [Syncephalis fuscata]
MSFIKQVQSKLPSPKMSAFLATVGTLFGIKVYDKRECRAIQDRFKEQARVKADAPMAVNEQPRRVEVYLVPPPGDGLYKPVEYFDRWVKPIWDAAAMDYDLIKCKHAGQAHHRAREAVKWRRHHSLAQPLLSSTASDKRPGTPVVKPSPEGLTPDSELPHGFTLEELIQMALKGTPAYALVAIGPLAFVEMVNGAAEGCAIVNTRAEKFISPEEELKQRAKDVGLEEQDLNKYFTDGQSFLLDDNTAPMYGEPDLKALPLVDMIPYRNRIGWSTIPGRIVPEAIGAEALRIALEAERPMTAADLGSIEQAAVDTLEGKANTLRAVDPSASAADSTQSNAHDAGLNIDETVREALCTFTMAN